ncbi:single-stranded DNA-binding protein, partial [Candidatus Dojkabacteria bacterium]|nr:single-stranded DNA-binding protein [Candidatus Dojkabacteria bacterium]
MATSRSLNKVTLIGNLSRDPEVRYTQNGALVCTFGLATNTTWLDSNGQQKESTEWHNIVAWNKLGEICANILSKGMLVYIEGELRTRVWGEDDDRRYRTEIKLNDMKLLDSKGKSGVGLKSSTQEEGE